MVHEGDEEGQTIVLTTGGGEAGHEEHVSVVVSEEIELNPNDPMVVVDGEAADEEQTIVVQAPSLQDAKTVSELQPMPIPVSSALTVSSEATSPARRSGRARVPTSKVSL